MRLKIHPYYAQFGFSVPKKIVPKAVNRNRIKRQMREVIRLQKHEINTFLEQKGTKCVFMLLYLNKEEIPYTTLEQKWNKLFNKFKDEF